MAGRISSDKGLVLLNMVLCSSQNLQLRYDELSSLIEAIYYLTILVCSLYSSGD